MGLRFSVLLDLGRDICLATFISLERQISLAELEGSTEYRDNSAGTKLSLRVSGQFDRKSAFVHFLHLYYSLCMPFN